MGVGGPLLDKFQVSKVFEYTPGEGAKSSLMSKNILWLHTFPFVVFLHGLTLQSNWQPKAHKKAP